MRLRPRTHFARKLRRDATDVENRLWRELREKLAEYRFGRQHPIGRYIVDFACLSRKLAIELGGGQHAARQRRDAAQSEELARSGYRVIRFWNNDVAANLAGVLETIRRELDGRLP